MSRSFWNPNKLFGRLDIRTKLAIAFMGLSGASLVLVGWYAGNLHLRSLAENATDDQRRSLTAVQERVEAFLSVVTDDLDLVAKLQLVRALLLEETGAPPNTGDGVRRDVESFLRDFVASKPHYHRLRLLGADGVEVVHTVVVDGSPVTVPAGRWQQTGFRYYELLVQGLGPEGVAFAPVQLRAEQPDGTAPRAAENSELFGTSDGLVSALSFVRPIRGDDGEMVAMVVADVYARALFELLEMTQTRAGESIFLVGPDGEFLYRSDRNDDWNTLLADPDRNNLRQELPDAVATRVLGGGSGVVTEGVDAVVTFMPLLEAPYSSLGDYVLVSTRPASVVFAPVNEMRRSMLVAGAFMVLVAGLLALVAAHQFAAPIRALTDGAARLARGEFDTRLEIETNDEIEDLARNFNSMAQALQTREAEVARQGAQLRNYADRLEAMVEDRTKELRMSQQKMVQQEKMVAVGQLAAGVAHELGTPLATILCQAQMAQEELETGPAENGKDDVAAHIRESLGLVVSQVDRCSQIVRKLLDFSRPSSDARSALRSGEVVDVAIELLRHDFERRGVEVETGNFPTGSGLVGNRNELEQVFVNLLRNAADAMPDGGRISITVEDDNSNVRFVVADEGHGIAPETQRHIFDPFFTTKAPGVGTGLGLWVVYNTVTDHGGRVDVDSAPGRGTRITVTLPAAADDPAVRRVNESL